MLFVVILIIVLSLMALGLIFYAMVVAALVTDDREAPVVRLIGFVFMAAFAAGGVACAGTVGWLLRGAM